MGPAAGPERLSLGGTWTFVPDPERVHAPDRLPPGEPIEVPGCWEAQVERPYRIITAWYQRDVETPASWAGRRVILSFEAVMYRCRVWLDGVPVGDHEGGYTPFRCDLSAALRPGERQRLAVEVTNPLNAIAEYPALAVDRLLLAEEWTPELPLSQAPHGKQTWYSSQSGIWGPVSLSASGRVAIDDLLVHPDVDHERAALRAWLDGPAVEGERLMIRTTVRDADGRTVDEGSHRVRRGRRTATITLRVPQPRLWDTADPHLYHLEAELVDGDELLDRRSVRFGMRTVEAREGRVWLNGRPLYIRGALDQDLYPDTISTPPSRAFVEEQFRAARELGLNLLRCHIKVPSSIYLDVADEQGVLLWCELPSWSLSTPLAAGRASTTLREMVRAMGNHPSVIAWTIVNEDWGTELRYRARDRLWLRGQVEWLRRSDPTRLVVDNSPCRTAGGPNFHVDTDILDFHAYVLSPDEWHRWRGWVGEFARRPAWLWSPHGDARERGDEPLVVSEFGGWGLPRPDRIAAHYPEQPWWFGTGMTYYRPAGMRRRFASYGLDRVWPDVDRLAEGTQWHQFESLQFEIGEIRRRDEISGYVVTEFTDAGWEANGLLDIARGRKAYHERLAEVNAPDVIIADLPCRDLRAGARVQVPLTLSSFGAPAHSGRVAWRLEIPQGDGRWQVARRGEHPFDGWPRYGARDVGALQVAVPRLRRVNDARLVLELEDDEGRPRARTELRLAILPARIPRRPLRVGVHDPLDVWGLRARVSALRHEPCTPEEADVVLCSQLDRPLVERAERAGTHVIVLVRDRSAISADVDLLRRVEPFLRRTMHTGAPGQASPWEGDWVTSYAWMTPQLQAGLPLRAPLDFAYSGVLPDHVLLGYDPVRHAAEVSAGMFVGWVHAPAALHWSFRQGAGRITLTTFRLSPESGPVADTLLQRLLRQR